MFRYGRYLVVFLLLFYIGGVQPGYGVESYDDKRIGLEVETGKIKAHNPTPHNLTFFKIGDPPFWEFTSDTLDKAFDKSVTLEKNIANVEARTILGQTKNKFLEANQQILLNFFPKFIQSIDQDATEEPKDWKNLHHATLKKIANESLEGKETISNVKQGKFAIGKKEATYLPQITLQVSLKEIRSLFELCRTHPNIDNFIKLLDSNKYLMENISSENSKGFLTLFYFYNYCLFKKDSRGDKKDIGAEPGVKSYLALMSRADLKVIFEKLTNLDQEEVSKKLTAVNEKINFDNRYIRYYLDYEDKNIKDTTTLGDFFRYIITNGGEKKPTFYKYSNPLYAYDKTISEHPRNIAVMEFRGFRRLLDADILGDNEKLHQSIQSFAEEFFKL